MTEDLCTYPILIEQIHFCSHPNDSSTSNNRQYLAKGMVYIVSEIQKTLTFYLNSQLSSPPEQNRNFKVYSQYKNSPEYLKLMMRYYLALKFPMNLFMHTLISASISVFQSQFQAIFLYIFVGGCLILAGYLIAILYWIRAAVIRYKLLLLSLTLIPKDVLLDSNTGGLLKKIFD